LLTTTVWAEPKVFMTAKDTGQRLAPAGTLQFTPLAQPEENLAVVFLNPEYKFQTVVGLGVGERAAETFARLSPEKQEEFLTACYDREKGLGYSLGRTHIHSCDFSSASYTYTEANDTELKTFSVAPDEKYRIPFIKRVLQKVPNLTIFVSPWSPPAWMKTNNDMLHGGKLKAGYAANWANYYVKFIQAYKQAGIPIWGLTVQNEPMAVQTWESCIYTAEDERDFVKNHLGPTLQKAGLGGLKLMIWDHNRGLTFQRAAELLKDPAAARYVWGVAYHWYDGDQFGNLQRVHDAFPDKALFFSEGCNYPFSWDTFEDWKWGENYGKSMVHDFNNWCTGWTDWNVLLDEKGGPNHVANWCFAPIHKDAQGELRYQNSYYYIGHFSRFVRPGARRIAVTSVKADLEATGFQNVDGSVVGVLLNRTDAPIEAKVWLKGQIAPLTMPAHSIATLVL